MFGHAYSRTGRIKLKKILRRSLDCTPLRLRSLSAYKRLLAVEQIWVTCFIHLRSDVKYTPRRFIVWTVSRCWLLIIRGWSDGWLVKKDTMNSLVFSTFSFILFAIDHWLTLSTSCCKVSWSDLPTLTTSERALSSTYLYKGSWLAKSFTMTRKNRGPSLVLCGTPALTVLTCNFVM